MYYEPLITSGGRECGTLCFFCQNAVPTSTKGCSWSRHSEPVNGWEATPTTFFVGDSKYPKTQHTFCVKRCPSFIPDEKDAWIKSGDPSKTLLKNDDGTCYYTI